jgi:flavin reductase (DIM6/NTAB) family NADH-FMN oxidoreductase RutF
MDPTARKTTLRMIPYGLYVLTAAHPDGRVAAATVNWVTQAAFEPPLLAVGVKVDSHAHALIKETGAFALNVLGKGQQALAYTFFKPAERQGETLSGEPFRPGATGAPILASVPAFVECRLEATLERGDHSLFLGRVVEVGLARAPEGRADEATLWLRDLGDRVYYGG